MRGGAETRLAKLFEATLGLDDGKIHAEDDFFLLGGHSLRAVDLTRRIRSAFGVDIALGAVFAHPTVGGLAAHVEGLLSGVGGGAGMEPLLPLGNGGDGAPVFCIHPAGGIGWCYAGLARALGKGRPVFALQANGLRAGQQLPSSLDAMAEDYVALIATAAGRGPVHLVGWSVGGIVAQTMAVKMTEAGMAVGALALLDAYPSEVWHDAPAPDERAALEALLRIAGHDLDELGGELTREATIRFLREGSHPLGQLPPDTIGAIAAIVENNARLVRYHQHHHYAGAAIHFRAAKEHGPDGLRASRWADHVGKLISHDLPFRHAQMLGPDALAAIVPVLAGAFDAAERRL